MDASSAARATGHAGDRCYSSVGFLIVAGGGEGRGDVRESVCMHVLGWEIGEGALG